MLFFFSVMIVLCFDAVIVEMRGQYGYLSAIEWPLLTVSCCIVHFISVYFSSFIYAFFLVSCMHVYDCIILVTIRIFHTNVNKLFDIQKNYYTGWLKMKYPTRQYSVSLQPVVKF